RKFRANLTDLADRPYVFALLNQLIHPAQPEFLAVYAQLDNGHKVCYRFDPHKTEEIGLSKLFDRMGYGEFLESICRYAADATGIETSLNGTSKDVVHTVKYDIDASIAGNGQFTGREKMTIVADRPTRLLNLNLHVQLAVDSVLDADGKPIAFRRYLHEKNLWYSGLYLYLDKTFNPGDTVALTVFCHGEIARRNMGIFFVTAMSSWYPTYGFRQFATFDMTFKTPKACAFVATGSQTSADTIKDTVISRWKVADPVANISFSIGYMNKYEFSDTLGGLVHVYFSEDIHREIAREYAAEGEITGSHMEKQVGGDIVNALRLFTHRFGTIPYGRVSVTEVFLPMGIAYPGFVQLGYQTWIKTDAWGQERLFRAHEAAHQWWGVGVGWETYHDQWLSEGFAEYCALMYLQATGGNDKFLDQLKQYRKAVIDIRERPTDSSSETGPIILGYRTSSTRSEGDASLVIYKKGALVLHMLRNMLIDWRTMKEDKFFALMQEFYQTYKGKTATTADFQRLVEKYTGEDMTWFFHEWIYGTEIPTYRFTYEITKGDDGSFSADCKVVTEGVSPTFAMTVPLEIQIDDQRKAIIAVNIDSATTEFKLPKLPMKPKALKLNPYESVLAEVKQ
ncbi:MAG: hypothetical protein HY851_10885, partial [candidate division Zixibacteria bacterium]|nr:hypothetical protein [candidate division Zixibacteria bacterium]